MTNSYDPKNPGGQSTGNQAYGKESRLGSLQSTDIMQMIKNNGTVKVGNEEFAFKNASDPKISELAGEHDIQTKAVSNSADNNECQYELTAKGKTPFSVTVCRKK